METIQNEELILLFAKYQLQKHGSLEEVRRQDLNNARTKMRSIARYCLKLKQEIAWTSLYHSIKPSNYEKFVKVAQMMSAASSQLGVSLSIYTKQLTLLKIAKAIEQDNEVEKKEAEDFLQLYTATWSKRVTSAITKRQRLCKLNKPVELPTDSDLIKLNDFISTECRKETDVYRLKRLILAGLLLFNKRRPMEVHDITVEDFKLATHRQTDTTEQWMVDALTPTEQALAKR